MPAIIVCSGAQQGLFIPLSKKSVVIGRDEGLPLQVEDARCSRKHAQIRFEAADSSYRLTDLKSTNGTFIAGRRLSPDEEVALKDNEEFAIGDTKLLFTNEIPTDKANALAIYKKVGERHRSTLMHP